MGIVFLVIQWRIMVLNHLKWIQYRLLRRYIRDQTTVSIYPLNRGGSHLRFIVWGANQRSTISLPQRISVIVVCISHVTKLLAFLLECLGTTWYQALKRFFTCVYSDVIVHRMEWLATSAAYITLIATLPKAHTFRRSKYTV